mmetsp:Transcript_28824/g.35132  ORF Transcript_28824/g.35132 Transcript_28824/m.35132 type:complete len:251 (-) Transcript_28824:188-940(-)
MSDVMDMVERDTTECKKLLSKSLDTTFLAFSYDRCNKSTATPSHQQCLGRIFAQNSRSTSDVAQQRFQVPHFQGPPPCSNGHGDHQLHRHPPLSTPRVRFHRSVCTLANPRVEPQPPPRRSATRFVVLENASLNRVRSTPEGSSEIGTVVSGGTVVVLSTASLSTPLHRRITSNSILYRTLADNTSDILFYKHSWKKSTIRLDRQSRNTMHFSPVSATRVRIYSSCSPSAPRNSPPTTTQHQRIQLPSGT